MEYNKQSSITEPTELKRLFSDSFDILPWRVVGPSVHICNSATNVRIVFKIGGNIPWVNITRLFFNFYKKMFIFFKFKRLISQYLFYIFSSILAYIFLRVVFWNIINLWKASGDIENWQRMARRTANGKQWMARRTLKSEHWNKLIGNGTAKHWIANPIRHAVRHSLSLFNVPRRFYSILPKTNHPVSSSCHGFKPMSLGSQSSNSSALKRSKDIRGNTTSV